jgi:hypothetical protein
VHNSSLLEVCAHLESILSDESLPRVRWMREAFMLELRHDARLAATAVVVYMINYLMSMSTQILASHLGTLELVDASLGNHGIQVFAYGLMVQTEYVPCHLILGKEIYAITWARTTQLLTCV